MGEPKEHKDHKEKHKKDKRDKHREKEKENLKEERRSEKEVARVAALKREERRSGSREGRSEDRESERARERWNHERYSRDKWANSVSGGGYRPKSGYADDGYSDHDAGYNRGSREEDSNEREEGELGSEADYVRDAQDV